MDFSVCTIARIMKVESATFCMSKCPTTQKKGWRIKEGRHETKNIATWAGKQKLKRVACLTSCLFFFFCSSLSFCVKLHICQSSSPQVDCIWDCSYLQPNP